MPMTKADFSAIDLNQLKWPERKEPERFVTYNKQVIDLERVMYLETFKTGNGYWIMLDGSTWNSESDCYNNAPYIQSDIAEEFKQVWMTYLTYKKN